MSLTLRHYPLASGVFNLSHLNENLSDIQDKFGNITNNDIASDAAIVPTKLSASNIELCVALTYDVGILGVWPVGSAGATPLVVVPLPGQSTDASWVVTDYAFVCSDVGTADGAFGLYVGHYDGAGVWTNDHTIVASEAITPTPVDNTGTQGRSARLSSPTITYGTNVKSIALTSTTQGTVVMNPAGFLVVSVRLRRVLQSI